MSTERNGTWYLTKSLRTAQQNSHHSKANIVTGIAESLSTRATNSSASEEREEGAAAAGAGFGAHVGAAAGTDAGVSNCAPGVEQEIASSSSFISAAMSANNGVLRY